MERCRVRGVCGGGRRGVEEGKESECLHSLLISRGPWLALGRGRGEGKGNPWSLVLGPWSLVLLMV